MAPPSLKASDSLQSVNVVLRVFTGANLYNTLKILLHKFYVKIVPSDSNTVIFISLTSVSGAQLGRKNDFEDLAINVTFRLTGGSFTFASH